MAISFRDLPLCMYSMQMLRFKARLNLTLLITINFNIYGSRGVNLFQYKTLRMEFYEARVSVGNSEYRTIVFAVESLSFIESKRVLFLNSFLKKGTKQYKGEVETARQILKKYM